MLERPAEVRFRTIGEGIHVLSVLGFPLPPPVSQEAPRLPIKTLPAETVEV